MVCTRALMIFTLMSQELSLTLQPLKCNIQNCGFNSTTVYLQLAAVHYCTSKIMGSGRDSSCNSCEQKLEIVY